MAALQARKLLNCLGRLCTSRPEPDPFGERNKLGQCPNLHFLHHPLAMSFDGPFGAIEYDGNLLISLAGNDQQKEFPFARRQSSGLTANRIQPALEVIHRCVVGYRPFND